jgi:hypothetical protein
MDEASNASALAPVETGSPGPTIDRIQLPTRVQQRAAECIEARRDALEPRQLFLPGMDEFMRAMPNHIARSSLFAPVARGRKRIHKDTTLVSRVDAVIKFWGEQLDETQADVWMQAMHEASRRALGEPVIIKRAEFLRSIGRQTGNYEYKWLKRTMEALTFAMLVIEVRTKDGTPKLSVGKSRALHLIEGFDFDDLTETYTLRIDPRWRHMFENREFALIDWDKRLRFGVRQDMAKALQRLVATSDDNVQRHSLDWLKAKLEYTGRMRDFLVALERAMRELERLDIIAGGRIETSTKGRTQAVWVKL